jgi:hypothetical protein
MLADASISRADVNKAKPQRGPAGHRATRTPVGGRTGGSVSGGGAAYRLQEWSSAAKNWVSSTIQPGIFDHPTLKTVYNWSSGGFDKLFNFFYLQFSP